MTEIAEPRKPSPPNANEPLGVPDSVERNLRTTFRRVGLVLVLGWAAWLLLSTIAIPALVQLAHRVDIPLLSKLMAGRATTPVSEYLDSWQAIARRMSSLLIFASVYVLAMAPLYAFATSRSKLMRLDDRLRSFWFQPAPVAGAICIISVAALFIVYYFFPVTYVALVVEDDWGEQAQFLSWFTVAFLLGWLLVERKHASLGIALMGVVGFFFAMEEISWGQRLLGFSTPSTLAQYNRQNELNIHNIGNIIDWRLHDVLGLGILTWTFLLPVAFRLFPKVERLGARLGIPTVPKYLWPAAITAAFFLLFSPLVIAHEIGELGAALFTAAFALAIVIESSRGERRPGPPEALGLTALIVVVFGLAALIVPLTGPPNGLKWRLNEMASHDLPAGRMYEQANVLFEYIEAHPEYRTERSRLNHAEVLGVLGRHAEARSVLKRDLADQAKRTDGRTLRAQDQRIAGETLLRLSRQVEALRALARALELDHATLRKARGRDQRASIHLSLAKTYRLLKDSAAVAEQARAALETSSALERNMVRRWLRENELSHLVASRQ